MAARESKFVISAENRASRVLKQVDRDLGGLGNAAQAARAKMLAIGASVGGALISAASLAALKAAVNRMDDLSKAAQRANLSTEAFSRLAYAGGLADVAMQDLQGSLGKLAKAQGDAQRGLKEQSDAFERLGIAYKNADGSLRDTGDVFLDFADKFEQFKGSPEIVALGMQIFGRSFQNLIPLLKDGSKGLREAGEEADRFGVTLSAKAGAQAEAFNDNLSRLGTQIRGFVQIIATEALGPAEEFTNQLVAIGSEALNARGGIRDLAKDGTLKEWAQNGAIAVATVGESLVFMAKAANTVAGSFSAVWADLSVASAFSRNMFGGFLFESNRKALDEALSSRNKTVEVANARLLDLINYDGAKLSNALREQFTKPVVIPPAQFSDARFEAARAAGPAPAATRPGPGKAIKSDAEKAAEAVSKMFASINADIARFGQSDVERRVLDFIDAGATEEQVRQARRLLTALDDLGKAKEREADAVDRLRSLQRDRALESDAQIEALKAQAEAWLDMLDPMREFLRKIEEVDRVATAFPGMFTPEQIAAIKAGFSDLDADVAKTDDAARELGLTFSSAFEDAIVDGKKFSDVLQGLGQDIARIFIRKSITEPLANALVGSLNLGSLFGGAKSHATGLDYVPYDNYPAILHRGERVMTAAENARGAAPVINQTLHIGAGVSRSEVAAALAISNAELKRQLYEDRRNGGVFA